MLLNVTHRTELDYDAPITETVMELRMTPRSTSHQTLRGLRLGVGPKAHVVEHDDWLGNRVHQFSVLPPHERVVIVTQAAVHCHPAGPELSELSEPIAPPAELPLPVREFVRPSRLVPHDDRLGPLADRLGLSRASNFEGALRAVTEHLLEAIRYERGVTHSATRLPAVLDAGAGVCQDLAHVTLGLLRSAGIPARYVSGYLHQPAGSDETESHAWCEAWCREHGWVALDPTHRTPVGLGYVTVGFGRDFSDVPPNRGVYRGEATESIRVEVGLEEVSEVPAGLLAPRTTQLANLIPNGAHRVHSDAVEPQQAQQQQ